MHAGECDSSYVLASDLIVKVGIRAGKPCIDKVVGVTDSR